MLERLGSARADFVACLIEYLTCFGETDARYRLVRTSTIDNLELSQAAAPPRNCTSHPIIPKLTTSTSDSKVAMARSTDIPPTTDNSASGFEDTKPTDTRRNEMHNKWDIRKPLGANSTPQRSVNARTYQHKIEPGGPIQPPRVYWRLLLLRGCRYYGMR